MSEKAREALQDQEIADLQATIYVTKVGTTPNQVVSVKTKDSTGNEVIVSTKIQ